MSAAVTRRHREGAFAAMGVQFAAIHPYAATFLETGADPHDIYPIAARVAQLAADCEARDESGALNRAWEEGRQAAPYCSARQERPHGGGITHYECKACEYGDVRYPGDEDWDDSAPTEPAIVNPYPKAPYQLKENERE